MDLLTAFDPVSVYVQAWQVFLFLNLIRDKVNFIVASPSNLSLVQDGFYILPQSREAAEGRARLRWHLHRLGVQRLSASQLLKIHDTLSRHHSKDPLFLHRLLAASQVTMAQKQPSWRCATCHVVMKGTFPRCWKCGQEWAIVTTHPSLHPITATSRTISNLADHLLGMDSNGMVTNQVPGVHAPAPGALPIEAGKATEATIMARWRSPTSWKRTWQRARAKFWTGSDGTLFALPEHDASVSTAHDAASLPPPMIDKGAGKGVVPPPPMMPPSTLAHAVPTMPWDHWDKRCRCRQPQHAHL